MGPVLSVLSPGPGGLNVGSSSSAMFLIGWVCLQSQHKVIHPLSLDYDTWTTIRDTGEPCAVGGSELRQGGDGTGGLVLWGVFLCGGGQDFRVPSFPLALQ